MKIYNDSCQPVKDMTALNFKRLSGREYEDNNLRKHKAPGFAAAGIVAGVLVLCSIIFHKLNFVKGKDIIKNELTLSKSFKSANKANYSLPLVKEKNRAETLFLPERIYSKNYVAQKIDYLRASFKKIIGRFGYDTIVIKAPDGLTYVQVTHGKELIGSVTYKNGKILKQSSNMFSRFDEKSLLTFDVLA